MDVGVDVLDLGVDGIDVGVDGIDVWVDGIDMGEWYRRRGGGWMWGWMV